VRLLPPAAVVFAVVATATAFSPPAAGQDVADSAAVPATVVPSRLAQVERTRSETCVPVFASMDDLDTALAPLAEEAQRIQALARAMALEDSAEVAPFSATDSLDILVRDWFRSDAALAERFVASGDSAVLEQRAQEKEDVRARLRSRLQEVGGQGRQMVTSAGDLEGATELCQNKILVRDAVLAACDTVESPVCAAARSDSVGGRFRFVDDPAALWDVESLSAWSDPGPLTRGPDGALVGGRTAAAVRRGNVEVAVGISPLLRSRSELDSLEEAEFDANLDSLGFTFQHPDLVMAPALDIRVDVPAPLDGETHYFLHFGDLSDPATQVVWTTPAGAGGAVRTTFPAPPAALIRLQGGEPLSLTAVQMAQPDSTSGELQAEAEARYTLGISPVAQAPAVRAVLGYMGGGRLSQDLNRLVPPSGGG